MAVPMLPPGAQQLGGARVPAPMAPPPKFHDVKVRRTRKVERAIVMAVPPEEFGISRSARNIHNCNYCFHDVVTNEAELIKQGFDEDQIKSLTTYTGFENIEQQSRDTVDETSAGMGDSGMNTANREVLITEHYIVMDYEDGPGMYRVTTGGSPSQILTRDGKDDIIKWDGQLPFAVATAIPMPHRFFGRSVADLVMDIQRQKTALIRGQLDNLYMRTNPRTEVSETHASVNTLDDLLVYRPGGIVRTKMPGGLNTMEVGDASSTVLPTMQYLDSELERRTGAARQGQGIDPNALQNQVATIANQMQTVAQAKVRMIARVLAETGVKDVMTLLHATIRRNGSQKQTVKLRGRWVDVDPRSWKARSDMTVDVGLGSGDKAMELSKLQLLAGFQEKAVAAGMVKKSNLYNTAKDLVRLVKPGNDCNSYFADPTAPQDPNDPILSPPDPNQAKNMEMQGKVQAIQMQAQGKLQDIQARQQLEVVQMQADAATDRAKAQNEAALEQQRMQFDNHIAMLNFRMDQIKTAGQARISAMQAEHKAQLDARTKAFEAQMAVREQLFSERMAIREHERKMAVQDRQNEIKAKPGGANDFAKLVELISAPKEIIRDKNGRMAALKPMIKGTK